MSHARVVSSLYRRLVLGYVVIAAVLLVAWIVMASSTHSIHQNYSRTVNTLDALAANILLRAKLMDDQETGLRGYLLTGTPEFLQPYRAAAPLLRTERRRSDQLASAEPGVRPLLAALFQAAVRWNHWAVQALRVARPGAGSSAGLVARQRAGKVLFDRYRAATSKVTAYLDAQRTHALQDSEALLTALERFLTLGFAGGLAAMALIGWRAIQAVRAPLTALGQAATVIGAGDLEHPVRLAAGTDQEFAALGLSMERMREQLRQNVDGLRASEMRFRAVTESAAEAIISANLTGLILSWNGGARTIFGYTEDEVVGHKLEMLMPERYRAPHGQGLRRVQATGESHLAGHTVELSGLRKDGTEFPLELSLSTWTIEGSTFVSGIIRDITAHKQAEAELIAAREAAVEASRLKSEFLASMSHEIRTPMSGVIGMNDLLLDTKLDHEQREYAATVRDSAQALLAIIDDILDFSKIEAGRMTLESVECVLADVVEGVADLMSPRARAKGLALMTYVDPALPAQVLTDPGRLRQVLLNVMSNAVKFTEQGQVVLRVSPVEQAGDRVTVRFAVADTGIGLSETGRRRLFQPFTQADGSTTRRYGGTGLGLSISRRLVELMGGTIGVESTEGAGSTFWFTLPLRPVEGAGAAAGPPELAALRVLVVDDSKTDQAILTAYLESWGMWPEVASSGTEALEWLRVAPDGAPAVALIDLAMPDMDGFALARAIQQQPARRDSTKLILITGYDQRGQGEQALASGFSAYLTKPIKRSYLLDAIVGSVAPPVRQDRVARQDDHSAPTRPAQPVGDESLILVAEDNAVNRTLVVAQLKILGRTAAVVTTGRAAVEAATSRSYALVLMDCQMPEMDGFEATKLIRKQESRTGHHVPIVALTANVMAGDREKCLAAGMDDYLAKPVAAAALRAVIERWLPASDEGAGAPGGTNGAVSGGGGVLDTAILAELKALGDASAPQLIDDLIGIYLTEAPSLLAEARQRATAGDAAGLMRAVHRLKGSSASIGATVVAQQCSQLEDAEQRGDMAEAGRLLERVEAAYAQVATALGAHWD